MSKKKNKKVAENNAGSQVLVTKIPVALATWVEGPKTLEVEFYMGPVNIGSIRVPVGAVFGTLYVIAKEANDTENKTEAEAADAGAAGQAVQPDSEGEGR